MPTQRLSMRRIKQLLTMHFGAGASTRAIGRGAGHRTEHGARVSGPGRQRRGSAGRWPQRSPTRAWWHGCSPTPARAPGRASMPSPTGRHWCETQTTWRQSAGAVGRVSGGPSGGRRVQPVLPVVPRVRARPSPTMRQQHVAGDKAFVDYSGKWAPIADPATGEVRPAGARNTFGIPGRLRRNSQHQQVTEILYIFAMGRQVVVSVRCSGSVPPCKARHGGLRCGDDSGGHLHRAVSEDAGQVVEVAA